MVNESLKYQHNHYVLEKVAIFIIRRVTMSRILINIVTDRNRGILNILATDSVRAATTSQKQRYY